MSKYVSVDLDMLSTSQRLILYMLFGCLKIEMFPDDLSTCFIQLILFYNTFI